MKKISFLLSLIILNKLFAVPLIEYDPGHGFNIMGINKSPYKIKVEYTGWDQGNWVPCNQSFSITEAEPHKEFGSMYAMYGWHHCGKRVIHVTNITNPQAPVLLCTKNLRDEDYGQGRNLLELDVLQDGSCGNLKTSSRKKIPYLLVRNDSTQQDFWEVVRQDSENEFRRMLIEWLNPGQIIANPDRGYIYHHNIFFGNGDRGWRADRDRKVLCIPNNDSCRLSVYNFKSPKENPEYKAYNRAQIYLNRIPAYAIEFLNKNY